MCSVIVAACTTYGGSNVPAGQLPTDFEYRIDQAAPELLALLTDAEIEELRAVERENATRLLHAKKRRLGVGDLLWRRVLPETEPKPPYPDHVEIIQDCPDCPKMAVIPAGSFNRKPLLVPGAKYQFVTHQYCRANPTEDYQQRANASFKSCANAKVENIAPDGYRCVEWKEHDNGTKECADFKDPRLILAALPMEDDIIHIDSFAMGITEVTIAQFEAFVRDTSHDVGIECYWGKAGDEIVRHKRNKVYKSWHLYAGAGQPDAGIDFPVACVDRASAQAYADWLSRKTGKTYRLPSQTEWQYAARAGNDSPFWWGWRIIGEREAFASAIRPVGQGWPSPFGLYDMYGNASEWARDCTSVHDPKNFVTYLPYLAQNNSGNNLGFSYESQYIEILYYSSSITDFKYLYKNNWQTDFWPKTGLSRIENGNCNTYALQDVNYASKFHMPASGWQSWSYSNIVSKTGQQGVEIQQASARRFGFRLVRAIEK